MPAASKISGLLARTDDGLCIDAVRNTAQGIPVTIDHRHTLFCSRQMAVNMKTDFSSTDDNNFHPAHSFDIVFIPRGINAR